MAKNESEKLFIPKELEQMFYETLCLETIKAQRKAAEATIQAMNTLTAFLGKEPAESAYEDVSDDTFDTLVPDYDDRDGDEIIEAAIALGWLNEDDEADCFAPYDEYADPDESYASEEYGEPSEGKYPPLFLLCDNGPKKRERDHLREDNKATNELFGIDEEDEDFEDDLPF